MKKKKNLSPTKRYEFKKTLRSEELQDAIPCPIEDPRNPFHCEYLKLKALSEGHLKEVSERNSSPSRTVTITKW
jgi:hypothetical protein